MKIEWGVRGWLAGWHSLFLCIYIDTDAWYLHLCVQTLTFDIQNQKVKLSLVWNEHFLLPFSNQSSSKGLVQIVIVSVRIIYCG